MPQSWDLTSFLLHMEVSHLLLKEKKEWQKPLITLRSFGVLSTCKSCGPFLSIRDKPRRLVLEWNTNCFILRGVKHITMKVYLKLILGGLVLVALQSCGNSKKSQKNGPIDLQQAFYIYSEKDNLRGAGMLELYLPVEAQIHPNIELDSVYFRGRGVALEKLSDETLIYVGRFPMLGTEKPDRIMSSDPRDEYGNKPPVVLTKLPFELEQDQALVTYKKDGESNYFKVVGIEERKLD